MKYDLIIIGAGPAGLAASIYASRYKVSHLMIGEEIGGMAQKAFKVENYPSFRSIPGIDLMQKFQEQAMGLGAEIRAKEIIAVSREGEGFAITLSSGETHQSKSLVLATGTRLRKLGVAGEEEFLGKGVSYCATCDAAFFRNKTAAVIGGSNSAATSALLLSEYADKVYLIYRKDKLRAEEIWAEKAENNPKIEIIYNTNVLEIKGGQKVEAVTLDNEHEGSKELKLDGVFVAIGSTPAISLIKGLGIETDEEGYVKVGGDGSTNIAGIYAAGDVTTGSDKLKQIVTAVAEGAVAAHGVHQYLKKIT